MNNNEPIRNIARCENRPLGGLKHNALSQNEARDPHGNVTDPMLLMRGGLSVSTVAVERK